MGYYVIRKSEKQTPRPYYFVLHANNGQAIAMSEMYATKQGAQAGIASVQLNRPTTDIRDGSRQESRWQVLIVHFPVPDFRKRKGHALAQPRIGADVT